MPQNPNPKRFTSPVLRDRRKTAALELIAARAIEPERIAALIMNLEAINMRLSELERIADTLDRAVIALNSIATALSLTAVAKLDPRRDFIGTISEPAPPEKDDEPTGPGEVNEEKYQPRRMRTWFASALMRGFDEAKMPSKLADEPTETELNAPPISQKLPIYQPHTFRPVEGNRYCGACGGGPLHPIHTPEPKHAAQMPHEFRPNEQSPLQCAVCYGAQAHPIHTPEVTNG